MVEFLSILIWSQARFYAQKVVKIEKILKIVMNSHDINILMLGIERVDLGGLSETISFLEKKYGDRLEKIFFHFLLIWAYFLTEPDIKVVQNGRFYTTFTYIAFSHHKTI